MNRTVKTLLLSSVIVFSFFAIFYFNFVSVAFGFCWGEVVNSKFTVICDPPLTQTATQTTTRYTTITPTTTTTQQFHQCCGICGAYDCSQCAATCQRVYGTTSTTTTTLSNNCGCGGWYYGTCGCNGCPSNTRCVKRDCDFRIPGCPTAEFSCIASDICGPATTTTTTTTTCQGIDFWGNNWKCEAKTNGCIEYREKCRLCIVDPCWWVKTDEYTDSSSTGSWACINSTTLAKTSSATDYSCTPPGYYTAGTFCEGETSSSTQYQNCPSGGWFNTTNKQWIDLDICTEKEQQEQELRSPTCVGSTCGTEVTDHRWIDTGKTRNKPDGTTCGTNSTACPGGACYGLNFTGYVSEECTRVCRSGNCGTCNSCRFTTETCTPEGCCDATCDDQTGCGLTQNDDKCPNYCTGATRHFSGTCESDCGCDYQTEDCNDDDGWYNTSDTKWVTVDVCNEKKQRKQEYRNYGCQPDECTFAVTSTRWVDDGVFRYSSSTTSCGTNSTSCNGGFCTDLIFNGWISSPCTRYCDGAGHCGTCNSCTFTSQTCNPTGCCDAVCNDYTGCGTRRNNANCQPYCSDDVRYYSGVCQSGCTCSYRNEDCNDKDGWYTTSSSVWSTCEDDKCKECEEKEEEYRDYFCTPEGCDYTVTDSRWISTGRRRAIVCPEGTFCSDGECVPKICQGDIEINFKTIQMCPTKYGKVYANGTILCAGKRVYFREGSCDGKTLAVCTLDRYNKCKNNIKFNDIGTPVVFACLDKNGDGDFGDPGEQDSMSVNVNCNNCLITGCPSTTGCLTCPKCGGYCSGNVNEYGEGVCLNPDQSCDYSCVEGQCGAKNCSPLSAFTRALSNSVLGNAVTNSYFCPR